MFCVITQLGDPMRLFKIIEELQQLDKNMHVHITQDIEIYSVAFFNPLKKKRNNVLYIEKEQKSANTAIFTENVILFVGVNLANKDLDNCSYLSVSQNIDPYFLFEFLSEILEIESQISADKEILFSYCYQNNKLDDILRKAHEFLNNPIILVDVSYKIIAMTDDFENYRPDLKKQKALGYVLTENIAFLKKNKPHEEVNNQKHYKSSEYSKTKSEWFFSKVYVENTEIAHLAIIGINHKLTLYDYEIIKFLNILISYNLGNREYFRNNKSMLHNYFVTELLNNEIKQPSLLEYRLHQINWKNKGHYLIATLFESKGTFTNTKIQLLSNRIKTFFKNYAWTVYNNQIVILLTGINKDFSFFMENSNLITFLEQNNLKISFSDFYSNLLDTHRYYVQSQFPIRYVKEKQTSDVIFFYENHKLEHVFSILQKETNLSDFYYQKIIDISNYDKTNKTSLLRTLDIYIQHVNNPTVASEKLFIHKNTLFYRINKIKELFSLDLNNGDIRFQIQFTLKLLNYENKM